MTTRRVSISVFAAAILTLLSASSGAQPLGEAPSSGEAGPPILTILSNPPNVSLTLSGPAEVFGKTPMDLPTSVVGRFSVLAEGGGVAKTQGVFAFSPRGQAPYCLSEPPGMSPGLLIRSLNYPGIPAMTVRRPLRGLPLALAETGALEEAVRAHIRYRDRLDEVGTLPSLSAREERRVRNAWIVYGASVWGMSAIDYWIRPRFTVQEATPTRLSLVIPTLDRQEVVVRSLIIPGAGQEFANHSTRGALWLAGVLAAGAAYTAAEATIQHKRAGIAYNQGLADSSGPTEQLRYLREVEILRSDLKSAEDARRGFGYAALGLYLANIVDALVLSIGPPPAKMPPRVSSTFPVGPGSAGFALTYRY
jgi:hypothetical protein